MQFRSCDQHGLALKFIVLFMSLIYALIPTTDVLASPKDNKHQLSTLVQQAQRLIDEYYGQGPNLEQAGELLVRAAKIDATYAPIYVQTARLTLSGGHIVSNEFAPGTLESVEAMLDKAVSLDPKEPDTYLLMAHVCLLQGRHQQAFENLTKASDLKSSNPWLLTDFGRYYDDLNQRDKATSYYKKVVEKGKGETAQQSNSYIHALLRLQWFAASKGDNENVLEFGKLATDAALPTDAWTWGEVAKTLFVQGFFNDAERHARKALGILNYGVGRGYLALALYGRWAKSVEEGHAKEAEPLFEEAYRLNPDLFEVIGRFNQSTGFVRTFGPILKKKQSELLAPPFKSADDFSRWLTFYYEKPEPNYIPDAVRYLSQSGVLDINNAIPQVFGFLSGVFRDNPKQVDPWLNDLRNLKEEHLGVVLLGLWYSNLPDSKSKVSAYLVKHPKLKPNFSSISQGASMTVEQIPLEQGPWVLDSLWGKFMATGESAPIERIISTLPLIDVKGDENRLRVASSASATLTSNAIRHKRVLDICENAVKTQSGEIAVILRVVIENAKKELQKRNNLAVNTNTVR